MNKTAGRIGLALLLAGCAICAVQGQAPVAAPTFALPELINLGLDRQPALAAARFSLNAAISGQRGVEGLRFGHIVAKDLPVRKQQAALGVTIAQAGLEQAEWETRY